MELLLPPPSNKPVGHGASRLLILGLMLAYGRRALVLGALLAIALPAAAQVPGVQITADPSSISEAGGESTVSVTYEYASVTGWFSYSLEGSTATQDVDFSLSLFQSFDDDDTASTTITALEDAIVDPGETINITFSYTATFQGVEVLTLELGTVAVTIEDNDSYPTPSLLLSRSTIGAGETATVSAGLDFASGADTTLTVEVSGPSGSHSLSSNSRLTIAAGSTSSTGTVRITGACPTPGDKTITVSGSASNSEGVTGPEDLTLTIHCPYPRVTLSVELSTIWAGGFATVTASLDRASGADTTVTVSASGPSGSYDLSSNDELTITQGRTSSTGTVWIGGACPTLGDKTITVSGAATNSEGVTGPEDETLIVSCPPPHVTLSVTPSTIGAGETATVSAGLDFASGADTRVTVSASGPSGTYSLSSNKRLTIADGSTSSTGRVTITGACPTPGDKTITVSGSASNSEGVTGPEDLTLTIHCPPPEVDLSLSRSTIEAGETATVTAGLDRASGARTTVTVSTSGPSDAHSLSTNKRLTITQGRTSSSGTVRITGACPTPGDKTITVSGSASNSEGVTGPEDLTLTIHCPPPEVDLSLSRSTIEAGETATVTAGLDRASGARTTVTVSTSGPSAAHSLSSNKRLTITQGRTSSSGTVRITGACPTSGDKTITVSGSASNSEGVTGPEDLTLTIHCPYPRVTLSVELSTIWAGGFATVTASLDRASGADTTVTVSASGPSGSYDLSSNDELTITQGRTSSTGTVWIGGACPTLGDKTITVSGAATNSEGVTGPEDETLIVSCPPPHVTLSVTPSTIGAGETATVSAGLDFASGADTRVTVSASGPSGTYSLSSNKRLTIADGSTSSTGRVTITGACPTPGDKTITVSGSASNSEGVTGPEDLTLTIHCPPPEVDLSLSRSTIEAGETATVTAGLDRASGARTTVTVSTSGPSDAHSLSTNKRLTITQGRTSSSGTVRITGACPTSGDKTITVSGSASNSEGVTGPEDLTLTIHCPPPEVDLSLSRSTIEAGETATVTAGLDRASGARTTVTVSTSGPSDAHSLSTNKRLTITQGRTSSSGTVRITGACPTPGDKTITVSGSASNSEGVTGPADETLTIDCPYPTPSLSLSRSTIEAGETATVSAGLDFSSGADTTLTVSASGPSDAYSLTTNKTLTIDDGDTASTGSTVTITGACPTPGDKTITVSASASNTEGLERQPRNLTLTVDCPLDTTAPMYWESSVSGSSLEFWYDETLDTDAPAASAFTVTVDSSDVNVDSVSISGRKVTLTLSSAVAYGDVVTLSYAVPGTDPIQDEAGNDAAALTNESVTNNTPAPPDTTAPVLRTATVDASTLVLTYDEALDTDVPSASAFTVTANDTDIAVGSVSISGEKVTLTLSSTVSHGDVVTLSYAVPGTDPIQDEAGNDAVALTNQAVPNNTPDTTAPMFWEASVNGTSLEFWYDETLDTDAPAASAFTVTVDSSDVNVDSVSISGRKVTLTLSSAVAYGDAVTLSYTAPQSNPLQDVAGNDAVNLTNEPVTNNTPAPEVTVSFDAADYEAAEGGASAIVTVTLNADPEREVEISVVGTPQGGATAQGGPGADYSGIPADVRFNSGITVQTFTVVATDDSIDDDGESVDLSFGTLGDGVTAGSQSTASVALIDNDPSPSVTLFLSPDSITENGGVSTVTASLSHASSQDTTVNVSVAPVSPAVPGDLEQSGTALTIEAGSLASTGLVTIEAVDNAVHAPDKMVTVSGTASNAQGVAGNPADVTLTIEEDDPSVTVSLVSATHTASEGDSSAVVTVRLSAASSQDVRVDYATADGTAKAGEDYESASGTLTFAASQLEQTVSVPITDDSIDEVDETFTLQLSNPDNATLGDTPSSAVTITDNDPSPTVTLTLSPDSITENGGVSTVTASLSHASSQDTTLTVSATPVSPAVPGDLEQSGAALTIAAGSTASTGTVTIEAMDNAVHAPDKMVTVSGTASNAQGVAGNPADVTLTIEEDDPSVTVSLVSATHTVSEGDSSADVTVQLSAAASGLVAVDYATADGTATAGEDYESVSGTLTFTANQLKRTISVPITDDFIDEEDETFTLQLSNPVNAMLGATASASVTIEDNDLRGVTIRPVSLSVDEGASAGVYEVVLNSQPVAMAPGQSADVTVTLAGIADTDLSVLAASLTFTPNNWDRAQKVRITASHDDDYVDDVETLTHVVSGADYGPVTADSVAVTVIDDDVMALTVSFVPVALAVEEGNTGEVTLRIAASLLPVQAVNYRVSTQGGTAEAVDDYTPVLPRFEEALRAEFRAQTDGSYLYERVFELRTVEDTATEADETFHFDLARLGDATGGHHSVEVEGDEDGMEVTIEDDDEAPPTSLTLTVNPMEVAENAGATSVTVTGTLDEAAVQDTQVVLEVSDGTATAADYSASTSTLTVLAGERTGEMVISLNPQDDRIVEGNKTVAVGGTAAGLTVMAAEVTITDDDVPVWDVAVSPDAIGEASGESTLTVSAGDVTFPTEQTITLAVSGTATLDIDYTLASTLALPMSVSSVEATLTALEDTIADPDETIIITASHDGTQIGMPVTVTISNGICGRTLQVRNAIVMAIQATEPSVTTCAAVTSAHLSSLTRLSVANTEVTALQPGDFAGLSAVTELFAGGNSLTNGLPAGVFKGLNALTKLHLGNSSLSQLDAGVFGGLPALRSLGLASNQLTSLPAGTFLGLEAALDKLYLGNNPTNPLPLTVSLEKVGADQFKAVAPAGAPFVIVLPVSVENGTIGGNTQTNVTIPVGALESAAFAVTRTEGTVPPVTVKIQTLPGVPMGHFGYELEKSTELPGTVLPEEQEAVGITAESTEIIEGAAVAFTLTRTGSAASDLDVLVRVEQVGDVLSAPLDYASPVTVTIQEGQATATLTVATDDDGMDEALTDTPEQAGRITATVQSGGGYDLQDSGDPSAEVRVLDNDPETSVSNALVSNMDQVSGAGIGLVNHLSQGFTTGPNVGDYAGYVLDSVDLRSSIRHTNMEAVTIGVYGSNDDGAPAEELVSALTIPASGIAPGVNTFTAPAGTVLKPDETYFVVLKCGPSSPNNCYGVLFLRRAASGAEDPGGVAGWSIADTVLGASDPVSPLLMRVNGRRKAPAPPSVSVNDSQAQEAAGATVEFSVRLDREAVAEVTVGYTTVNGTAKAGEDYTAASGTLTFATGDISMPVSVAVLEDMVDEGSETFTLVLHSVTGAQVGDADAIGTISNTDPLPQAWLTRFGRTVASHVAEGISERLMQTEQIQPHATFAGVRLPFGESAQADPEQTQYLRHPVLSQAPWDPESRMGDPARGRSAPGELHKAPIGSSRGLRSRDLLLGSSFLIHLGRKDEHSKEQSWTLWGRGMATRFDSREETLALDGEVATYMFGADTAWARWLAGVALAHSRGDGGYDASVEGRTERGELKSTMTSVHPYVRFAVSERLSAWGVLGYGSGDLTLKRGDSGTWNAPASMRMAAAGARGVLKPAVLTGGFELALRSDALWASTGSAASENDAGRVAASRGAAGRVRLILEGSRTVSIGARTLTPTVELGLRHDAGDAETGTGVEIGGGLTWTDPALGLNVEVKARGLIAHQDAEYREWGASAALRLNPGASGRGLMLTLTPSWGAPLSGTQRLWSQRDAQNLTAGHDFVPSESLNAEIGYALDGPRGLGLQTPYAALSLENAGGRTLRIGWRLAAGPKGSLNIEAMRRQTARSDAAAEHGILLRAAMRW